tara:strand:+ start:643 stop:816 length:174 start_codon:yes stop_codon:yes gene_type:complete
MPNNIKAMISLLTLVVGGGVHYFERQAGNMDLAWIATALSIFMVAAMWIFPEATKKK